MNWNGQQTSLNHLIDCLLDPHKAGEYQRDYNARRLNRIMSALCTRPVFIPLEFVMTAAAQTSPYRALTPSLNYDVIVTGLKSDTQTRSVIFREGDEKPLTYVGDEANLYLRCDEISGQNATNGGGQLGVFYLPQPLVIEKGRRLAVEMFKTDATGAAEEANIVLVGVRVYPRSYGEVLLDVDERERIETLMTYRDTPRIRFLKQDIDFDSAVAGGRANNLATPAVDEPLLIRGVRTSLRESLIDGIRIQGEAEWTTSAVPCWAIAAEDELVHENYQWFSKPLYLRTNNQIEIPRITNSIDGTLIDAQTDNYITWICETV